MAILQGALTVAGTADISATERWHELLSTRYVCEICLTRYFRPHAKCPACHQLGHIRPLVSILLSVARSDAELREMLAHGQTVPPHRYG